LFQRRGAAFGAVDDQLQPPFAVSANDASTRFAAFLLFTITMKSSAYLANLCEPDPENRESGGTLFSGYDRHDRTTRADGGSLARRTGHHHHCHHWICTRQGRESACLPMGLDRRYDHPRTHRSGSILAAEVKNHKRMPFARSSAEFSQQSYLHRSNVEHEHHQQDRASNMEMRLKSDEIMKTKRLAGPE
jgi:hypothetical protein